MLTRKQAVFFCFTEFEKLLEKDIWSSPNFHEMEKVAAICTFSYFCPLKEDEIIVIFQQIPYWLTLPSGSTTGMRPSEGILASTRFPSWSLTGTAAPWESEWLQSRKGTRKGFLGLTHRGAALGAHCTHAMKKWKNHHENGTGRGQHSTGKQAEQTEEATLWSPQTKAPSPKQGFGCSHPLTQHLPQQGARL